MAHFGKSIDQDYLEFIGLNHSKNTFWNLPPVVLLEHAIHREEGMLAAKGGLVVQTGKFTGRSPKDKYFVKEPTSEKVIWWGTVNHELSEKSFDHLYHQVREYLAEKDVYIQDLYGGAHHDFRLPVRIVTEFAWHSLFAHQLLVREDMYSSCLASNLSGISENLFQSYTVICAPGCLADTEIDGLSSSTFIVIHPGRRTVLIGGTEYAGEIKKSVFTILNYLLPERGVLPMHCSANVGKAGDTTLFFGLSGTGKTTLSADRTRDLVGDDEHGWSPRGVFNFEGGCYAKCINLSENSEPEIWKALRFGAVLENVVLDPVTRELDFESDLLTENTRAAYPINHIDRSRIPGIAGHPSNIVFLTADAFGVLPPIAKLSHEQAKYHFLNGYTAKIAGTERGLGKEPQATFSACFGMPFLPLHPTVYSNILEKLLQKHNTTVWLVNTGWSGGVYGTGKRIALEYTRRMVEAAIDGELENTEFTPEPIFGLLIPKMINGVPTMLLSPRNTWSDTAAYDFQAKQLADLFQKNYEQYQQNDLDISAAA